MYKKVALTFGVFLAGIILLSNAFILSYYGYIISASEISTKSIVIVFGGGMKSPGVSTDMQQDRVDVGVELYKSGKIEKLMLTGDDGAYHEDEVTYMRQRAIDGGVPAEVIVVDPHGYRTYESCYRLRKVYGVKNAVAISNTFHLSRILYLCRGFGIEMHGVSADLHSYGFDSVKMNIREALARVKAVWQFGISHPLPRSLER